MIVKTGMMIASTLVAFSKSAVGFSGPRFTSFAFNRANARSFSRSSVQMSENPKGMSLFLKRYRVTRCDGQKKEKRLIFYLRNIIQFIYMTRLFSP